MKICGLNDVSAARMVAELKPDALGLNFHPPSPRCVDLETAKAIGRVIPAAIELVGVFVNPPLCEIATVAYQGRLDRVQLHGDEPPEFLAEIQDALPGLRLIRAWRLGPEGLDPLRAYLEQCQHLGVELSACLLDARVEGVYGGSGKTVAWDVVAREYPALHGPPLILAGGLTPRNVAQAIAIAKPWGVDVASGVESSPPTKDPALVRQFLDQARG